MKIGDKVKIIYPDIPEFHNTFGTIMETEERYHKILHDKPITFERVLYKHSLWPVQYIKFVPQQLFFNFMDK